jgi:hypothetical protein
VLNRDAIRGKLGALACVFLASCTLLYTKQEASEKDAAPEPVSAAVEAPEESGWTTLSKVVLAALAALTGGGTWWGVRRGRSAPPSPD